MTAEPHSPDPFCSTESSVSINNEITVEIRPAHPDEKEAVTALVHRNLDEFPEAGDVLATSFKRLENIDDFLESTGSRLYVVTHGDNETIVGAAFLGTLAGLPESEGIAEIRDLVIDKSYRQRGIGRMLFMALLSEAKKIGYHRIYLETTPQMEPAQILFKSVGFKAVKQHKHHDIPQTSADSISFPCYFVLEKL